ncbi:MAG: HEPN domain-containing protein [Bacteroidetes bacterium]|nr:HEPN domain-containing protein [Bacteroidota bacterium]
MVRKDIAINWLKRAKSNLIRAKFEKLPDVYWEDLCYDAQQACEKSLKALLIFNEIKFRFVHDIGELINTLKKNQVSIPAEINESVILSEYAVETRYPFPSQPVSEHDYVERLLLVKRSIIELQNKLILN